MKKSVLMFSLLSGTALMFPKLTIASGFPTHTHTYTPEPKPAFQFEQTDKAFKTAAVCFLGAGDCGDAGFGSMGGDDGYKVDTVQQCGNEGYSVTSCSLPAYPSGQCPYNSAYFAKCAEDRPAPAVRPVMSTAATTVISRTILKAALMTALIKNASAIRATVTTILWKKPMPKDMKPAPSATAAAQ